MFCYQCEQTAKGEGCTKVGVCGKQPDVAALQDLLVYALAELSFYATEGRKVAVVDSEVDVFATEALFATLTNVDFDPARFVTLINRAVVLRTTLKETVKAAGGKAELPAGQSQFKPEATLEGLIRQGEGVAIQPDSSNPDITSLKHTLLFGLKGVAAYVYHAQILGQEDSAVYAFIHEALVAIFKGTLWSFLMQPIPAHTVIPFLLRSHSVQRRERLFSFPDMTLRIWKKSSNRLKGREYTCILTVKCCLPMAIQALRNIPTFMDTTVLHGRTNIKNLPVSPVQYL